MKLYPTFNSEMLMDFFEEHLWTSDHWLGTSGLLFRVELINTREEYFSRDLDIFGANSYFGLIGPLV